LQVDLNGIFEYFCKKIENFKSYFYMHFIDKLNKRTYFLINIVLIIICIKLYTNVSKLEIYINESKCISEKIIPSDDKPNVNVVNLSRPLLPANIYDKIMCRKSAQFVVRVELCIHDLERDIRKLL
jgi:hypothetical protein